ncbi:hypothetical protein Fot_09928 [Forsythia ovata]|uniref:Uncharacterized protein n=1 Tax=Forsythia ovata TaxID=205694 RepID=A0ABD1WFC9_9LAMI
MARMKDKCLQLVLDKDSFALEVMTVPLLESFERLDFEKYDRTTDSLNHLRTFVDLMRLHGMPLPDSLNRRSRFQRRVSSIIWRVSPGIRRETTLQPSWEDEGVEMENK